MTKEAALHFFDINSILPGSSKSWSPNTLRTRMVLNYKGIRYTQSYISYPDIAGLLQSLSIPAFKNTRIDYTLPAIVHTPSLRASNPSGAMNDSWPIALHLEKTFPAPEYPSLFPTEGSYALALAVQKIINGCMTKSYPILISKTPNILDPEGVEHFYRTRESPRMLGKPLSEVSAKGEALEKAWRVLLADLELLAEMFRGSQDSGESSGPFFEGDKPGYADFIVASYLAGHERVDKADWERIVNIGRGEFKRLWDACLSWINGQGKEMAKI